MKDMMIRTRSEIELLNELNRMEVEQTILNYIVIFLTWSTPIFLVIHNTYCDPSVFTNRLNFDNTTPKLKRLWSQIVIFIPEVTLQ